MNVRDLIPMSRNGKNQPSSIFDEDGRNAFLSLHRNVNRIFDDVFRSYDRSLSSFGAFPGLNNGWPNVEVSETDSDIKVTAEIAGLDEKDVEVLLKDGVLTLKGEKRSETEDEDKQFSERFYGRFERRIPLGTDIDEDKVEASFKNGLLSVVLPKSEKAVSQVKRIEIKS